MLDLVFIGVGCMIVHWILSSKHVTSWPFQIMTGVFYVVGAFSFGFVYGFNQAANGLEISQVTGALLGFAGGGVGCLIAILIAVVVPEGEPPVLEQPPYPPQSPYPPQPGEPMKSPYLDDPNPYRTPQA